MLKFNVALIVLLQLFSLTLLAESGWTPVYKNDKTIKLKDSFGTCTATFISNNGHALTARHCLNACLISKNFVDSESIFPSLGWQSPKLYHFPNSKKAICEFEVNGSLKKIEILAASSTFMTRAERSSLFNSDKEIYFEYLDKGFFHNGDFAIIKVNDSEKTSCRKVRSVKNNPATLEEPFIYYGYPAASEGRPKNKNSDGKNLFLGKGLLKSSITENSCLSESSDIPTLQQIYDRPELLLSDVDLLPGASGSALLDSNNEIVGLLNSSFMKGVNAFKTYCSGSAVAIKIDHVLELAKTQMQEEELKKAFSCQSNQ